MGLLRDAQTWGASYFSRELYIAGCFGVYVYTHKDFTDFPLERYFVPRVKIPY